MHPTIGGRVFAAVDLGASSGRVIAGVLEDGHLHVSEIRRFPTTSSDDGTVMRWNISSMFQESLVGLQEVQALCERRGARFAGIGVDSWGVDYGLFSGGALDLSDVRHHRKAGVAPDGYAHFTSTPEDRYRATGILDQSINTIQQLAVRVAEGTAPDESIVLFVPDVWVYLLAGTVGTDPTIASTSQMLDLRTGNWAPALLEELGPTGLNMPPLNMAGSYAGATTAHITQVLGSPTPVPVFRVAGHDTASGLGFATPAKTGCVTQGIVSSGTWSLAGLALTRPIATEEARQAGFTTERGLRGFLMVRNLSGMWLLQECLRAWQEEGSAITTPQQALSAAQDARSHDAVLDLSDGRLLGPGDMPRRLRELALEVGRPAAGDPGSIVRIILDSLAAAYVSSVDEAARLAGVAVHEIRIIGGGSLNPLLCQLTADRAGRPVVAGPAEATAIGNLVTQVWATGIVETIEDAYDLVSAKAWSTVTYLPTQRSAAA